jgi:Fe-Mn family superoxide dismutase
MNPLSTITASLRYELDALEPVLSRETVQYHLIQHHRRCYERTAALVKGTELEPLSLEALVRAAGRRPDRGELFMLAAEAWNHDLYWRSLQPAGGGLARGAIAGAIARWFGDFSAFVHRAQAAAQALIGSGWLWVTWRAGRIEVVTSGKADSPLLHGHVPLIAIDLWEHAYYLDYYNARSAYVRACLTRLIDWDHANERLAEARAGALELRSTLTWLAWGASKAPLQRVESGRREESTLAGQHRNPVH